MALPFILAGAAAAVLGVGAKKAYDGYTDNDRAKEVYENSKRKYEEAENSLESANSALEREIKDVGEVRLHIGNQIKEYREMSEKLLEKFEKYAPNTYESPIQIDNLKLKKIDSFSMSAAEFSQNIAKGAIVGGASAYAIYGGVMALATASTGTAISTLSGVAATNAALAAIGGGSLAAGGLGIAGGTVILGGVVAAPVIAIAAWSYASNAEENLRKAQEARDENDRNIEKMNRIRCKVNVLKSYVYSIWSETREFEYAFKYYHKKIKYFYDKAFIEKISDKELEELLSQEPNLKQDITDGYAVAAILTEVATTSLFKLKTDDEGNHSVQTDSDGVSISREQEVRAVIFEQKLALEKFTA
ncbi:hypothetical protein [Basfia succiniciproducens]|uniref:hypothetical protein n=1 Tax=Basfia succiniciproducens TaxID=653940 RepID=UPI0008B1F45A|nr:hypothetical protein [Basfia succiniciproducens]SEP84151.1 hypothetical protein SAMN02910415_00530 [Basfia succiniciproducens]